MLFSSFLLGCCLFERARGRARVAVHWCLMASSLKTNKFRHRLRFLLLLTSALVPPFCVFFFAYSAESVDIFAFHSVDSWSGFVASWRFCFFLWANKPFVFPVRENEVIWAPFGPERLHSDIAVFVCGSINKTIIVFCVSWHFSRAFIATV